MNNFKLSKQEQTWPQMPLSCERFSTNFHINMNLTIIVIIIEFAQYCWWTTTVILGCISVDYVVFVAYLLYLNFTTMIAYI